MSHLATPKSREKKRKHIATDGTPGEPSTKRSKTEPKTEERVEVNSQEKKRKDKGKARADDGQFKVMNATMAVSIPPVFANNQRAGVEEMLDSMIMRYIPAVQGVVLAYDNLTFLESTARIKADCPYTNCRVSFDATVWSPSIGMKLVGKVNLCSPDHISLLLHRTFNVSIPRHHIPTDNWEFEYGPAANDPEFGVGTSEMEGTSADGPATNPETAEGSGKWTHKVAGALLGGTDGYLEFTVIGLTIANQMLSLVGSLQQDPFSPVHVPGRPILTPSEPKVVNNEPLDPGLDDDHIQLLLDEDSDEDIRDIEPPPEVVQPKKSERKKDAKEKKRKREKPGRDGEPEQTHEKKRKKA